MSLAFVYVPSYIYDQQEIEDFISDDMHDFYFFDDHDCPKLEEDDQDAACMICDTAWWSSFSFNTDFQFYGPWDGSPDIQTCPYCLGTKLSMSSASLMEAIPKIQAGVQILPKPDDKHYCYRCNDNAQIDMHNEYRNPATAISAAEFVNYILLTEGPLGNVIFSNDLGIDVRVPYYSRNQIANTIKINVNSIAARNWNVIAISYD
jgi:hypothetical protein